MKDTILLRRHESEVLDVKLSNDTGSVEKEKGLQKEKEIEKKESDEIAMCTTDFIPLGWRRFYHFA